MQRIRQRYYHIFQQLHLPLSMVFLVFVRFLLHEVRRIGFFGPADTALQYPRDIQEVSCGAVACWRRRHEVKG